MWPHQSSSSSSSSSTSSAINPTTTVKSMEEVWKDITLAYDDLHHRRTPSGIILQDFFSKDPIPLPSPTPPPPPTLLTLNSNRFLIPPPPFINPLPPPPPPPPHSDVGNKRFLDCDRNSSDGCDRRQKRMIKNRESAARSRARKQESLFLFL